MTDNLPVPDDMPWVNLSPEEVEQLRNQKRTLTAYATQKLRRMKAEKQTQELLNASRRVAEGEVPLGKLIREGHDDPMTTRVRYEYAALLRELINQCGYDNYHVDGDHGLLVVNVRDILGIIEVLEEMK
jgi:hypothetical protein